MHTAADLCIRPMALHDLDMVLNWAAAEGWNPGNCDVAPFLAADPSGFLLAELDGEPVGSISAVAYDAHFGFIGLFIVRPEYRGQGFGRALFNAGLGYLGNRTIGLDGVTAQQAYYHRHGFDLAYQTSRYEGASNPSQLDTVEPATNLVELRNLPLETLTTYDAKLFPAPRPAFLEKWIGQPGTLGLGLLHSGQLAGYGVLRPSRAGYRFGPLVANDPSSAASLFDALLAIVPGEAVYLDVPEPNQAATMLAKLHGMKPMFDTARMYRGMSPSLDLSRVFGVTSLELG